MDITELMKKTRRPDQSLFYRVRDPNDPRLGAVVAVDASQYEKARFLIVSQSQDVGITRNAGRAGAAAAPESIRRALYRLTVPAGLPAGALFDLGDTALGDSLEAMHDNHFQVVRRLVADGKRVIILGGGNDIAYPDGKAMQATYPGFTAVSVDSHLDTCSAERINSGSAYRQLIEEQIIRPQAFYAIGVQPHCNAPHYLEEIRRWKGSVMLLEDLVDSSLFHYLERMFYSCKHSAVMLGFDMDAVKCGDAPGVSDPSTTGLTAEQAQTIVRFFARDVPATVMEITEVNPQLDLDDRTSMLAAILVYTFIAHYRLLIG